MKDLSSWTAADWIGLAILLAFFGFLGRGAWRLRRIKRLGLAGHAHRELLCGDWQLVWPEWWPRPRPRADGSWIAGPLDHDGRLELHELGAEEAAAGADAFFRGVLESHMAKLDAWDLEELPCRHGLGHVIEGRANWELAQRQYLWLARVPGPGAAGAFLLLYRASVLYGLADGFWLAEVAARARRAP